MLIMTLYVKSPGRFHALGDVGNGMRQARTIFQPFRSIDPPTRFQRRKSDDDGIVEIRIAA